MTKKSYRANAIALDTPARRNNCPETIGKSLACWFEIHQNSYDGKWEVDYKDAYRTARILVAENEYEAIAKFTIHLNTKMDATPQFFGLN